MMHEVDNLTKLCNEIFGEENFVARIRLERRTRWSEHEERAR